MQRARPNNSFKPTPHRGVNSVLCATLHAVATPLRGGLTQALGDKLKLNRDRQREILDILAACYPAPAPGKAVVRPEEEDFDCSNMYYLQEHGLIKNGPTRSLNGEWVYPGAVITAAGLDFIADDGGLSAILGTITVKIHADSIRELLQKNLDSSNLPTEKKSWLRKQVSMLSDESLKTITKSLVQEGIDNVPDLAIWLKKIIGLVP